MPPIKHILLCALITSTYACNLDSNSNLQSNNSYAQLNPQQKAAQLKLELKQQEQASPLNYLKISNIKMRENIIQKPDLFHHTKTDGWLLEGTLYCNSTIAKFKDAVILVKFYSETQTEIGSSEYPIYKFFNPNSQTAFECKIYPPEGFKEFNAVLKTAKAD